MVRVMREVFDVVRHECVHVCVWGGGVVGHARLHRMGWRQLLEEEEETGRQMAGGGYD